MTGVKEMTLLPKGQATVRVPCECPHCPNYLTLLPTDRRPLVWFCPPCDDVVHQRDLQQMARYYKAEDFDPQPEQEPTHR